MSPRRSRSPAEVWTAPVLVGGVSAVGLAAALVHDGAGDIVSWVALSIPVILGARALWPVRSGDRPRG